MVCLHDHCAKHALGESAVTLDRHDGRSRCGEIGEEINAALIALDVKGEPTLIPLDEADDFATVASDGFTNMIRGRSKISGDGLREEEHTFVLANGCFCSSRHLILLGITSLKNL